MFEKLLLFSKKYLIKTVFRFQEITGHVFRRINQVSVMDRDKWW